MSKLSECLICRKSLEEKQKNVVTCSHNCSRKYQRIVTYLSNQLYEKKRNKNGIKKR